MSTGSAVTNGLQGALLLARGRAEGLRFIAPDRAFAARSFWAIALCIPGDLFLMLTDWAKAGIPPSIELPPDTGHVVGLRLTTFLVGWLAFAVLSHGLVAALERGELWARYIAAWNWCNVVQQLLLVAVGAIALVGVPDVVTETLDLAVFGWSLWLEWFTARHALRLGGLAAASVVGLDVLIGWFLATVTVVGGS
ncbi:MAG TPA: hypothetical protein VJY39_16460 [Acidisphaera sp.]|nr:hypothetical protein [Acidisphaera sp.]